MLTHEDDDCSTPEDVKFLKTLPLFKYIVYKFNKQIKIRTAFIVTIQ